MNVIFEKAVERPVEGLKEQMETISSFRWHYYIIVLLSLIFFSSIVSTICTQQEKTAQEIRSRTTPAVQCLQQINGLISCLKK